MCLPFPPHPPFMLSKETRKLHALCFNKDTGNFRDQGSYALKFVSTSELTKLSISC